MLPKDVSIGLNNEKRGESIESRRLESLSDAHKSLATLEGSKQNIVVLCQFLCMIHLRVNTPLFSKLQHGNSYSARFREALHCTVQ